LVVRAEVPGFAHDHLSITAEPRVLTITGERSSEESTGEGASYHRRERQFGKFSRKVQLPPDLDTERAEASCRDGVLTVRIPKRPELQPRTISISQD
jgi:HSP20 family protein